jgi:hypothetical protein
MKKYLGSALSAVLLVAAPSSVSAGELKLTLNNGMATVIATDVPLSQILQEWARVGKTTVVNADKVTGPPVTVILENVPERQALDVLLRSASGYIVGSRQDVMANASAFDRILIMPPSRAPAAAPISAPTTPQRFNRPPVAQPMAEPDVDDPDPPVGPVMGPQGEIPHPNEPQAQPGIPQPENQPGTPATPPGTAPRPGMPTALPPGQPSPYPTVPGARPPRGGGGADDRRDDR